MNSSQTCDMAQGFPVAQAHEKQGKRIPGEIGIWMFVFGDIIVFSLFFVTFLFYRGQDVAGFQNAQEHLNQTFGALNTFLMLSSSWFVAMAVHAARKKMGKVTPALLVLALGCGIGFVIVKVFEYGEKIRSGITIVTNDFYMYYFVFTGVHLMHVLIGIGVLLFMIHSSKSGSYNGKTISNLESGATFWHAVDLLWIVLFGLLYLVK